MATNGLSPEDLAYYAQQKRSVNDTAAVGRLENTNAEQGANLTYAQKIQSLQETLTQQRNALPDKFAARGIQNSGIYGYGGMSQYTGGLGSGWQRYAGLRGGQLGAMQQFKNDSSLALSNLVNDQRNVDAGYGLKLSDLNTTANDQLQSINVTEAAQNAAQAAANAIQGA